MKDNLSIFTDAPIPNPKTVSKGGGLVVLIYLILCAFIFASTFTVKDKHSLTFFFGILVLLGSPTSFIMMFCFSLLAKPFDDTDLFYVYGYPTFRYMFGMYSIAVFGIAVNSFFLFFVGERLEELFRKRK